MVALLDKNDSRSIYCLLFGGFTHLLRILALYFLIPSTDCFNPIELNTVVDVAGGQIIRQGRTLIFL